MEGLYKLRIRESEKLGTVLELYDLEIHQKKLGPDYHRLKAVVKRSIEQEFEIRTSGPEMEILRRTPWSRIRGQNSVDQEFLEIVSKETIAVSATILISVEKRHSRIRLRILSCSRMSEKHREPEVPEAGVPVVERLDGLARITLEELAITHFCGKVAPSRMLVLQDQEWLPVLGKSAHMHTVRLMNSRLKGPKRMMTKVQ